MKRYEVIFFLKDLDGKYSEVGKTQFFVFGDRSVVAQAFLNSPNPASKHASRLRITAL